MSPHVPDVVVVGGGPAGSTIATLLARRGRDVWILDRARFPRTKPCGECLDPGAVAALGRLGLLDEILALEPARLEGWRLRAGGADASAAFGRGLVGLGVPRVSLDAALLDHARRSGVRVEEGAHVLGVTAAAGRDGRPSVDVRTGAGNAEPRRLHPRVVVGADGLRSVVVRSLGLLARPPRLRRVSLTAHVTGDGLPAGRGLMDISDSATLGVAPVGRGVWNVTVVTAAPPREAALTADPAGFLGAVLRSRLPDARWRMVDAPQASGPFDWPTRRAWAPGVVLVGDAAGYYDPFTGQGIYRALRTAELGAEAVHAALAVGSWAPLSAYARRWAREVRWGRRIQRAVEAVVSRPRLRRHVVGRLGASGGLSAVIRVTGDAAPPITLLDPAVWLGWGGRREAS